MKISIIIATHRRPHSLARLLESLYRQARPDHHELLVAENGTPQPTTTAPTPIALQHLHDPRPGKCRVQNQAIKRARGEIIVCLDDDLFAAPDYLAQVEAFFNSCPQFAAMKGRILPARPPASVVGPMAAYLDLPIVDHGLEIRSVHGVLGANMGFRREVFERLGGFDERLGPGACGHEEETEFSSRMRAAGLQIGYAPGALVYHEVEAERANRARFLRVARERGRCRMLHEAHGWPEVLADTALAAMRLTLARALPLGMERLARAEKRMATALGMIDGLRRPRV
ncbi:MAG TPA: glycosyltransferase [Candidatus Binataceae bacterium]|nr:glycosyltransferase [Candidatus Binataceae bacterium]